MNILIIGSENQPIPPVNGGAVENLIKMFYEENEKIKNCNINLTIISCYDEKIKATIQKLENVSFIYINNKTSKNKLLFYLSVIFYKIFKKRLIISTKYSKEIVSHLLNINQKYDAILIENYIECVLPIAKTFPSNNIYLHLHNDKLNNSILNGKSIVSACKCIITVSDYIKNQVNTIPGAKSKTQTLINSICVDRFNIKNSLIKKMLRTKYNISNDQLLVMFSGRITKEKGVLELIKAFKLIKNENIKLIIIGSSWYGKKTTTNKYIKTLQAEGQSIKHKIIFTGYIDYDEMPLYYNMADIVVIPSIWQEPCSLTLFEAMASYVPLITTKTGGTVQVVKNYAKVIEVNKDFIKNLAVSIEQLVNNPSLRINMANSAFAYVQQYNPQRYYKQLIKILKGKI